MKSPLPLSRSRRAFLLPLVIIIFGVLLIFIFFSPVNSRLITDAELNPPPVATSTPMTVQAVETAVPSAPEATPEPTPVAAAVATAPGDTISGDIDDPPFWQARPAATPYVLGNPLPPEPPVQDLPLATNTISTRPGQPPVTPAAAPAPVAVAPRPLPVARPVAVPQSTPALRTMTLKSPQSIQLEFGAMVVPAGSQVQIISETPTGYQARFQGNSFEVSRDNVQ